MRTICGHRLDDPRLTDEVRALMVRAAMERRRTAGGAPRGDMATLIKLSNFDRASPASSAAVAATDNHGSEESLQAQPLAPRYVTDPQELQRTISVIQKRVSDEFRLSELRDPDLKIRSQRQVFAFPRQLAMYIARHVTGASLQEIGRHFGGRHHSTVLYSINKVEEMLHSNSPLNQIVKQLVKTGKS
jgi:chromosomal replication initiator protein